MPRITGRKSRWNYYNEFDPFAAQWLRELIRKKLIPDGEVDERDIREVKAKDLEGFVQHHVFAGIGGWPYALKLSGWPEDRPVWTGSCPCQPFSAAGRQGGTEDERHLWPVWFDLIRERKPVVVFGEQVASKGGLAWFDTVRIDLEREGYAVGSVDLGAASIGAPHIRQRLWFVADHHGSRREPWRAEQASSGVNSTREQLAGLCALGVAVGDTNYKGSQGRGKRGDSRGEWVAGETGMVGVAHDTNQRRCTEVKTVPQCAATSGFVSSPSSYWSNCEWLPCTDGKHRPVEPGTFPLAHGVPARVGRLRGYGNAIVPQVAATFIQTYLEIEASG